MEHQLWSEARKWYQRPPDTIPYFKSWFFGFETGLKKFLLEPKKVALLCAVAVYRYSTKYITPVYDFEVLHLMARSPRRKLWEGIMRNGESQRGHDAKSWLAAHYVSAFDNVATTHMKLKSIHHLLTAEELLGKSLDSFDNIVEFGAGSGEVCTTVFDTGWKGKYFIVDFPELHAFQSYYLEGKPVTFVDNIKSLPKMKNTLFLSTWGLSETPLDLREEVTKNSFKAWFITYQKTFEDIDNENYFTNDFPYKTRTAYRTRPHRISGGEDVYYAAFPING